MQKPALKYFTSEEYLALEETAEYKSEYYQGKIFAIAESSINQDRIVRNLALQISGSLVDKKYKVFANDLRLWVENGALFTHPDVLVVCGRPKAYKNRRDTVVNPLLIVEVTPASAQNYGRGQKFRFYRSIPTLREYLWVDQYKIHIEQFSLDQQNRWTLTDHYGDEAVLHCTSIDFKIPLRDIYHTVEFENAKRE